MPNRIVVELLVVGGAAVLIHAGLSKFVAPASITKTVQALGVSGRLAGFAVAFLGAGEVLLGALVALWRVPLVAMAVAGAGLIFALVGAVSLLRGQRIPCGCFSTGSHNRMLGWRQVAYLPAWLVMAAILLSESGKAIPLDSRLATASAALVLAYVPAGFALLRSYRTYRGATER